MSTKQLKVAAVVFPGFELLDLFGPLELFGLLPDRFALSIIGEYVGLIASAQGPRTVVDALMSEVDELDILLVPGGNGTRQQVVNDDFLSLLQILSSNAQTVASVCTGSALLARAGILDGRKATTNKLSFDWVATQGTEVEWISEARWVEDGKFFTASGVSAGMDMTLGLIRSLFGRATSLEVARIAEYIWNEDSTDDPFAMAEEAHS